jgi:hypothetical protein
MRWSGIEELSCFIAHRCLDSESYRIVERASMFKTCAFSWRPGRRTREHISACMPSGHQDAARARRHSDNGTFFSGHRPHLNNRSWPRPRCSECRVFFFCHWIIYFWLCTPLAFYASRPHAMVEVTQVSGVAAEVSGHTALVNHLCRSHTFGCDYVSASGQASGRQPRPGKEETRVLVWARARQRGRLVPLFESLGVARETALERKEYAPVEFVGRFVGRFRRKATGMRALSSLGTDGTARPHGRSCCGRGGSQPARALPCRIGPERQRVGDHKVGRFPEEGKAR